MPAVTIYTTPVCAFCKLAKDFFKMHNVAYTEKDVARDPVARAEMLDKSRQLGVPVIDVDGTIIVGFYRQKLVELLGVQE